MDDLLSRFRAGTESMLADLERLVEVESPSEDIEAVRRGCEEVSHLFRERIGAEAEMLEISGRPHLLLQTGASPCVLLLAHIDTVWPIGTSDRWPFSSDGSTATGPGVFDMKAGLIQGIHALAMTRAVDQVAMLVTTDEEIGSPTSRQLIEGHARDVDAVLVLEPSADGALKTARKGVSMYRVEITGSAAHAGLDPESGTNALVEMGRQLDRLASISDLQEGTTVTPTRARAGSTINTVPAQATLELDVRAWTSSEQRRVDDAIRGLRPFDSRAILGVRGGINRPPLERAASQALLLRAEVLAKKLDLPALEEASVGGGSDGNFAAAVGTPTLDGLGAVGGGAHAEGEYVEVSTIPERAALLQSLIEDLLDSLGRD